MLEDAGGIRRVILACGFVDLRKGIDGLAQVIGSQSVSYTHLSRCRR